MQVDFNDIEDMVTKYKQELEQHEQKTKAQLQHKNKLISELAQDA